MNRRDVLKIGGAMVAHTAAAQQVPPSKKSVIVVGAGIAGLSCGYELMRRGHDVTVLEASGRPGGHVRTFHDPFADGLYADIGAEHFYYPGYTEYWRYLKEFGLTAEPYPHRNNIVRYLRGKPTPEDELHSKTVLTQLGFNQRETDFLVQRPGQNFHYFTFRNTSIESRMNGTRSCRGSHSWTRLRCAIY